MSMQIAPSEDPGLWSVLENGLAVLHDEQMDEERRNLVLDCLVSMFAEAGKGSKALEANMFAAFEDSSAIQEFSLFFTHLSKPLGDRLPERLNEAHELFRSMREGNGGDASRKARAEEIIQGLLAGLEHETLTAHLVAPREIAY